MERRDDPVHTRFDTPRNNLLDCILDTIDAKDFPRFVDIVESVDISYLNASHYSFEGDVDENNKIVKFIERVLDKTTIFEEGSIALKCFWYLIDVGICTSYSNGRKKTLMAYVYDSKKIGEYMLLSLLHSTRISHAFDTYLDRTNHKTSEFVLDSILSHCDFKMSFDGLIYLMVKQGDPVHTYIVYKYTLSIESHLTIIDAVKKHVEDDIKRAIERGYIADVTIDTIKTSGLQYNYNDLILQMCSVEMSTICENKLDKMYMDNKLDFNLIISVMYVNPTPYDKRAYKILSTDGKQYGNVQLTELKNLHILGWRLESPDDILSLLFRGDDATVDKLINAFISFVYRMWLIDIAYAQRILGYTAEVLDNLQKINTTRVVQELICDVNTTQGPMNMPHDPACVVQEPIYTIQYAVMAKSMLQRDIGPRLTKLLKKNK